MAMRTNRAGTPMGVRFVGDLNSALDPRVADFRSLVPGLGPGASMGGAEGIRTPHPSLRTWLVVGELHHPWVH